jgi:polyhydroxyalkanoate synthesis regulator phasin
MADDRERTRDAAREWVRATTGILAAFKEAIEETIDEMRERGDVAPERAKEAVRSTMRKAQQAVEDTRERLDFAPRRELDELRSEVADLRRRVTELEGGRGTGEIPVEGA